MKCIYYLYNVNALLQSVTFTRETTQLEVRIKNPGVTSPYDKEFTLQ